MANLTSSFEIIRFTNVAFGKVLTIQGNMISNNVYSQTSFFGLYASIDKIPTKKEYQFYIPLNKNFSTFSKGSEHTFYFGISGPALSSDVLTYVLNVDIHAPNEMPQSILSIILTSSIVILILVISTFLIQTGISISIVLGVDFCSVCRKRKKHGYAQIDSVSIQQQE
ncbi:hypothetical protein C9374_009701 [Naegleria lovaniensis]|uniref:Uncharacterized protein n=1 Tax=Naegleria lovaniensis TaxID=51637 RepID=A0AA88H3R4_NAELO|nr:uncharacterized protein C9374_009701 [Naegleria lovaniensis]KAG2393124.1 hypothetical protein C9374_009701 [Naegleria lovaniensis]